MNKLFINMMLALTPVVSTMASEMPNEIETHQPVNQQMIYLGAGCSVLPGFSTVVLDHITPVIQLGHRIQRDHHGFDYRLEICTPTFEPSYVKGSMAYQYYLSPELDSQTYVGLGASTGTIGKSFLSLTPELRIGKEYNKSFIEMKISPQKCQQPRIQQTIKLEEMVNNTIRQTDKIIEPRAGEEWLEGLAKQDADARFREKTLHQADLCDQSSVTQTRRKSIQSHVIKYLPDITISFGVGF